MSQPTAARFRELFQRGKAKGLNDEAARAYATLAWWGEWYGIKAAPIRSGYRDPKHQRELQRKWDRGNRAGMRTRPASSSTHTTREGFDLAADEWTLAVYGAWASHVGARWGGDWQDRDTVHFDVRR